MCLEILVQHACSHITYVQSIISCDRPARQTCYRLVVTPHPDLCYKCLGARLENNFPKELSQQIRAFMANQPPYQGQPYRPYEIYPGQFNPYFIANGAPMVPVVIPPGGDLVQVSPPPAGAQLVQPPPVPVPMPQNYYGHPQFLYQAQAIYQGQPPQGQPQPQPQPQQPPGPNLLGPFGPGYFPLGGGRGYIPNDPPVYYRPGQPFYPQNAYNPLPRPQAAPPQPAVVRPAGAEGEQEPIEVDLNAIPPYAHAEYVYRFVHGAWRPFQAVRAPDPDPPVPGMRRQQGWNPQHGFDEGNLPPGWADHFRDLPIVSEDVSSVQGLGEHEIEVDDSEGDSVVSLDGEGEESRSRLSEYPLARLRVRSLSPQPPRDLNENEHEKGNQNTSSPIPSHQTEPTELATSVPLPASRSPSPTNTFPNAITPLPSTCPSTSQHFNQNNTQTKAPQPCRKVRFQLPASDEFDVLELGTPTQGTRRVKFVVPVGTPSPGPRALDMEREVEIEADAVVVGVDKLDGDKDLKFREE